ncbi:MAG TPA: TIM barrel protein [Candidatus Nanoarchaeia archaeon]|nr:TIM barrel protein [Candidatus Nanoarchaeia archaeon]
MADFGKPLYGGHSAAHYFAAPQNAMDSGSYGHNSEGQGNSYGTSDLGVDRIGMSVPMGIAANNVAGIYSKIRMGAGSLEIQFPGHGSGRPNAQTPEMYGKDQRTAIREMVGINEVDLTTHASFAMSGMTGFDGRSYDIKNAQKNLEELKTAIDFQADVAGGGSVVMHAGEFERPITDMYLDDEKGHINLARDPTGRLMFRQFNRQEGAAQFMVIDDRTHAIQAVQRDRLASYPVWNTATKDKEDGIDQDGNRVHIREGDYIDYEGRRIINPWSATRGRLPKFNDEGLPDIRMRSFDYFRQEAEERNAYEEKRLGRKLNYWEKLYPEEAFARAPLETQEAQARGSSNYALSYLGTVGKEAEKIRKLQEARAYYAELDKNLSEEEKKKLLRDIPYEFRGDHGSAGHYVESEKKSPLEIIDDAIKKARQNMIYLRSSIQAGENQAEEMNENKQHIIAPIKRLEREGIRLYAEAGIHALQRTKDPDAPVVVAIEHIFPEQFGGHPEELKWIIKKSRERMVDLLTEKSVDFGSSPHPVEWEKDRYKQRPKQPNPFYKGIDREEAQKLAEKHLKVTIDTGHINMWRKYWQQDPEKTPEENDRLFKDWAVKSIESLAKEKMVGNVHLADNFGYHDDHLAPGQGNSPVREIMNVIRKYGYEKAITVEPGADATTDQGDFFGLMKTWRFFGSPVYGMGGGSRSTSQWNDIQGAYFGQGRPPNYIFGAYAPSNEWQLWSQVPLE